MRTIAFTLLPFSTAFNTMINRSVIILLLLVVTGCVQSYHYLRQNLASHVPRSDGSILDVKCVSKIKHVVASVSLTLQPEPKVTIILDDNTFEVFADRILLDERLLSALPNDVKEIRIDVDDNGFAIAADGEHVENRLQPSSG